MELPRSSDAFVYIDSTKDQKEDTQFLDFQNNYWKKATYKPW